MRVIDIRNNRSINFTDNPGWIINLFNNLLKKVFQLATIKIPANGITSINKHPCEKPR